MQVAAEALEAALATVEGLRVARLGATAPDPPAAIVGPPQLTFESFCVGPTEARFVVWVAVPADDRAMERLWELVPLAAAAINTVTDASVTSADPAVFEDGGLDLPAYTLLVPVTLSS